MDQTLYWMVHNTRGSGSPNVQHPTMRDAIKEAKRLAFSSPGTPFTVLQVVDCYMKPSDGAMRIPIVPHIDCSIGADGPMDF